MKIVRFIGGLGNQMFQYAFYRALASKFPDVKADLSAYKVYSPSFANGFELPAIFDIELEEMLDQNYLYASVSIGRPRRKGIKSLFTPARPIFYEEQPGRIDPGVFEKDGKMYYSGFWQSPQYFAPVGAKIRALFSSWPAADAALDPVIGRISNSLSVAVHVRRGDYLETAFDGVCTLDYYQNAQDFIGNKLGTEARYFIFSDDLDWCREHIHFPNQEFVDCNRALEGYRDMQLMSMCKHQVIANSSFSWWSAWLNPNHDKMIVCPASWVNIPGINTSGLIPEAWIKLPGHSLSTVQIKMAGHG